MAQLKEKNKELDSFWSEFRPHITILRVNHNKIEKPVRISDIKYLNEALSAVLPIQTIAE